MSLLDFIERVPITKEQIIILIRLGVLRVFEDNKCAMLWEFQMYTKKSPVQVKSASMFPVQPKKVVLPDLGYSPISDAYDEIELLGFPISVSMFDMLETAFRGELQALALMSHIGKKVRDGWSISDL